MIIKFLVGLGILIIMFLISIAVLLLVCLLTFGIHAIRETKIGKLIKFIGKIIGKILYFTTILIFTVCIVTEIYQLGDLILR